jgi:hypothetical protein
MHILGVFSCKTRKLWVFFRCRECPTVQEKLLVYNNTHGQLPVTHCARIEFASQSLGGGGLVKVNFEKHGSPRSIILSKYAIICKLYSHKIMFDRLASKF